MDALLAVALAYSVFMAAALPTIVPRLYEPLSRRPEAIRLTWSLASILPLLAALPPLAPIAVAAAALAYRGRRVPAAILSVVAAVLTTLVCYK